MNTQEKIDQLANEQREDRISKEAAAITGDAGRMKELLAKPFVIEGLAYEWTCNPNTVGAVLANVILSYIQDEAEGIVDNEISRGE